MGLAFIGCEKYNTENGAKHEYFVNYCNPEVKIYKYTFRLAVPVNAEPASQIRILTLTQDEAPSSRLLPSGRDPPRKAV